MKKIIILIAIVTFLFSGVYVKNNSTIDYFVYNRIESRLGVKLPKEKEILQYELSESKKYEGILLKIPTGSDKFWVNIRDSFGKEYNLKNQFYPNYNVLLPNLNIKRYNIVEGYYYSYFTIDGENIDNVYRVEKDEEFEYVFIILTK